ncbi:MAG TPA: class I SAM-dependent methyltransferase, partial [Victivallales bacterium]|nr:class I SAM-dependent methyltransferase [Victivallales bacterium]
IDMSKYALAEAKKNISNVNFSCEFICNDAMLELQNINEKYNIIVAGYMLQHLNDDQLTELLRNVYLKLKNRYGYVFWYDMFRNNNLELIEYRNIFHNEIYKNWNDLTMEERDITLDHTKNHDYIRSYEEVELYAKKAGFREVKKVYSSENGYYAAFILCK